MSPPAGGGLVWPGLKAPEVRPASPGLAAPATRAASYLFDHDPVALDLDHLHPRAGHDVAALRHHVHEALAELALAGRPQRRGGDADGAEQMLELGVDRQL